MSWKTYVVGPSIHDTVELYAESEESARVVAGALYKGAVLFVWNTKPDTEEAIEKAIEEDLSADEAPQYSRKQLEEMIREDPDEPEPQPDPQPETEKKEKAA